MIRNLRAMRSQKFFPIKPDLRNKISRITILHFAFLTLHCFFRPQIDILKQCVENLNGKKSIEELMGVEGFGAKEYFRAYGKLLPKPLSEPYEFTSACEYKDYNKERYQKKIVTTQP